jgi:hypothetical protein
LPCPVISHYRIATWRIKINDRDEVLESKNCFLEGWGPIILGREGFAAFVLCM